jgi:hypothetical protein
MTAPSQGLVGLPVQVVGTGAVGSTEVWERLTHPAPPSVAFDPAMIAGLPEPARRWLSHAIASGTPLHRAALLEMEGHIRLGPWLPFLAVQVQAPPEGYVWAARTRLGPLFISGYDRYADGAGEMRWRLLGQIPVVNAAGPDLDRSAAGRVALDALFVPTAWLDPAVTWHLGEDENSAVAEWKVGGQTYRPRITVGPNGNLVAATMPRWAKPKGFPWGEYPCGGTMDEEAEFGGITIPTRMQVGYFFGTDRWRKGEFFRATITRATYL